MSTDIWEPWQPMVGQRVKVRVSGECTLVGSPDSPAMLEGRQGHDPEEDGRTGVVVEHPLGANALGLDEQGHRYRVRRDGPPIRGYLAGVYASIELEPIPAPGAADTTEAGA